MKKEKQSEQYKNKKELYDVINIYKKDVCSFISYLHHAEVYFTSSKNHLSRLASPTNTCAITHKILMKTSLILHHYLFIPTTILHNSSTKASTSIPYSNTMQPDLLHC